MKLERRLRFLGLVQIMLVISVLVLDFFWGRKIWMLPVAVTQLLLILYGTLAVYLPLRRFHRTLRRIQSADSINETIRQMDRSELYMEDIQRIMDSYVAQETKDNEAQILDKQTALTALQSQINPHFLYNTLDTIRGQALIDDNEVIALEVEALSAFFRYSISGNGGLVTLREELANVQNYMLIQKYRFSSRFSLEIRIDEEDKAAYDFLVPRLIVQPVVENAIFHGLEDMLEGGKITIEIMVTDTLLFLTISDNGKGIERKKLNELNERISSQGRNTHASQEGSQKSTGIALPNIHRRLQLLFGEEYGIHVYSTIGQGTDVEIVMPADYSKKSQEE